VPRLIKVSTRPPPLRTLGDHRPEHRRQSHGYPPIPPTATGLPWRQNVPATSDVIGPQRCVKSWARSTRGRRYFSPCTCRHNTSSSHQATLAGRCAQAVTADSQLCGRKPTVLLADSASDLVIERIHPNPSAIGILAAWTFPVPLRPRPTEHLDFTVIPKCGITPISFR